MSSLDKLPLFASDEEIAEAIVGKKLAPNWLKKALPALERLSGFPKVDPLHGGRPVPMIKNFYADYLGLACARGVPDGEEGSWKKAKRTNA